MVTYLKVGKGGRREGGERGEWEDLEVAVYGISDVQIYVFWYTRSSSK